MAETPPVIEFSWWPEAPSIYATATQLKQAGLKPGGPAVARVSYGHGRRAREYLLYDSRQAVACKQPTAAQRAALEKAQLARRTCVLCGRVVERPSDLEDMQRRRCWQCYEARILQKHARAYDEAVLWARDLLWRDDWVVLDTETTDLWGRVIEIGMIRPDGSVVLDTLVNPQAPVKATYIHGITDAMVADAPTFAEIEPALRTVFAGKTVVTYNAEYDRGVIHDEVRRMYDLRFDEQYGEYPGLDAPLEERVAAGDQWHREVYRATNDWMAAIDWQCAMLMYSQYCGDWSDYHGDYRFQRLPGAGHRAVGDALACLEVIRTMAASPLSMDVPDVGERHWWTEERDAEP